MGNYSWAYAGTITPFIEIFFPVRSAPDKGLTFSCSSMQGAIFFHPTVILCSKGAAIKDLAFVLLTIPKSFGRCIYIKETKEKKEHRYIMQITQEDSTRIER